MLRRLGIVTTAAPRSGKQREQQGKGEETETMHHFTGRVSGVDSIHWTSACTPICSWGSAISGSVA